MKKIYRKNVVALALMMLTALMPIPVIGRDSTKGSTQNVTQLADQLAEIAEDRYKKMIEKQFPVGGAAYQDFLKIYRQKVAKIDVHTFLTKAYTENFTGGELEEIYKFATSEVSQRYTNLEPDLMAQAKALLLKKIFEPMLKSAPPRTEKKEGEAGSADDGPPPPDEQAIVDAMTKNLAATPAKTASVPVTKESLAVAKELVDDSLTIAGIQEPQLAEILQQLYAESFSAPELTQIVKWRKSKVYDKYKNTLRYTDEQFSTLFMPQFAAAAAESIKEVEKTYLPPATSDGTNEKQSTAPVVKDPETKKQPDPPTAGSEQQNSTEIRTSPSGSTREQSVNDNPPADLPPSTSDQK